MLRNVSTLLMRRHSDGGRTVHATKAPGTRGHVMRTTGKCTGPGNLSSTRTNGLKRSVRNSA